VMIYVVGQRWTRNREACHDSRLDPAGGAYPAERARNARIRTGRKPAR
jgi:hypothetical protein